MASVFSCFYCVFASNWIAIAEVTLRYLLIMAVVGLLLVIVNITYSFDELNYELRGFVEYYRETSWWWLTSFFASLIALTIGSEPGLSVDLAVLSAFIAPAIFYFHRNYPFSLKCDYRSRDADGKTLISEEKENIASKTDGLYILEFPITTGKNIDKFKINLEVPDGVKVRNLPTISGVGLSDEKDAIIGEAPPGGDTFVVELIIEETTGVQRGSNLLVLSDDDSERNLKSIRLMP